MFDFYRRFKRKNLIVWRRQVILAYIKSLRSTFGSVGSAGTVKISRLLREGQSI